MDALATLNKRSREFQLAPLDKLGWRGPFKARNPPEMFQEGSYVGGFPILAVGRTNTRKWFQHTRQAG